MAQISDLSGQKQVELPVVSHLTRFHCPANIFQISKLFKWLNLISFSLGIFTRCIYSGSGSNDSNVRSCRTLNRTSRALRLSTIKNTKEVYCSKWFKIAKKLSWKYDLSCRTCIMVYRTSVRSCQFHFEQLFNFSIFPKTLFN